jgi:hypothetical protein
MKVNNFTATLRNVSQEDIVAAAWSALLASAWILYTAQMMAFTAGGRPDQDISDEEKVKIARRSFAYVANYVPEGSPFRAELERYAAEAIVDVSTHPSVPSLRLV